MTFGCITSPVLQAGALLKLLLPPLNELLPSVTMNTSLAGKTLQVNTWNKKRVVCSSALPSCLMNVESLTSERRGLCRGCRAAWRCRSLYCSCCFLTRWWCSRRLSGPRIPAPPCPTERRRDSSSPADTQREGKTKHTDDDGIVNSLFNKLVFVYHFSDSLTVTNLSTFCSSFYGNTGPTNQLQF